MLQSRAHQEELIGTDYGCQFVKNIRGTQAYWESTLKDLFAMIRQLGILTWFCSFSSADRRWKEIEHKRKSLFQAASIGNCNVALLPAIQTQQQQCLNTGCKMSFTTLSFLTIIQLKRLLTIFIVLRFNSVVGHTCIGCFG
ncbi:hypothetical protein HOLleu_08108 [Holothuria leucospilota]|uniref:Uncharacterized protein n=1 Tax=Holothuria leucospilota TaxID=206669 RepID=A0A9Q1HHK8_HOLLE|nr:hypothetical protein HOLleu_08108 [Holothuria leucospilota]